MIGSRGRNVLLVVVMSGALLCGGCGLAAEKRPHEISRRALIDLVKPATSTTLPPRDDAALNAELYFVKGPRLEPVFVPAGEGAVTPERALRLLLNGVPRNAEHGLTTSIPTGTTLREAKQTGALLRIDLSGEIKSLGGSEAKAAYAQLVFTALELPGVTKVHFAIEGDDIDAITDDGSQTVITSNNYRAPLNPL